MLLRAVLAKVGVAGVMVIITMMLCGCIDGDYASVTISYQRDARVERWSLSPSTRQRIVSAFERHTESHGYKCRPHVKRVEEITCRGPKDLHMTFQPELNKSAFIARFNWLSSRERTHDEFHKLVSSFANDMTRTVDGATVRLEE